MIKSRASLEALLQTPLYQAYTYSYPHKTAYRPLDQPLDLPSIWQQEKLDALFLYVHIPFCSMRCGFCNLFTLIKPDKTLPDLYLDALERQIEAMKPVIEQAKFARYAIGGGTPTFLTTGQLERLFDLTDFDGIANNTPIGVECSPETVSADKIQLFAKRNVNRISMGVQSFTDMEVKNLARRQDNLVVNRAIDCIRSHSKADLNLDLIYGIAGQTVESWRHSLKQALVFEPEELYLYPLYVRTKTGLGKVKDKGNWQTDMSQADMLELYRVGRDFLCENGYRQISMRMFRKANLADHDMPVYSCQEDGMLSLGAGARSYTNSLHYSSEYSVGRHGVNAIIDQYCDTSTEDFTKAVYGITLDQDERKRRFVMQSLLIADGLNPTDYHNRFGTDCLTDFAELGLLLEADFAQQSNGRILLTAQGLERADSIGPWFSSNSVRQLMAGYKTR